MIESVLADAGSATSMAVAIISTSNGGSTAPLSAAAAAAAAVAAPCLAGAFWRECGEFRIRKAVPAISSPLTSKTAKILTVLRGGGSTVLSKKAPAEGKVTESKGDKSLATRGKAVAFMAVAMACHYLGE